MNSGGLHPCHLLYQSELEFHTEFFSIVLRKDKNKLKRSCLFNKRYELQKTGGAARLENKTKLSSLKGQVSTTIYLKPFHFKGGRDGNLCSVQAQIPQISSLLRTAGIIT